MIYTIYRVSLVIGLGVACGCSGNKVVGNQHENPVEIQIGDFRGDPDAPAAEPMPSLPVTDMQVSGSDTPELALSHHSTARPTTGRPSTARTRPTITSGDGLEFLDAKVGDISGHPIYVSSFFEPIEDRLITLGNQSDLRTWRRNATGIIVERLDGIIYDELLRAETIAALTPNQRIGLQSFLKDFRSNLLSENLGSAELTERRVLEEQGMTLDEALRQKELDTLVGLTLYQEINRRINVSWRDIKQRYERDIDLFQPPPTVVLRVIRVLEPEGELVDSITARLNSGEAFEDIASSDINTFNKDTHGTIETLLEKEFGQTPFFAPVPLNEAVWGLSIGEWTGPVSLGNSNFWIKYAELHQDFTSLYDAQLQIHREITQERRIAERKKYLMTLIERARVTSRDEILMRLIYIAETQYGPSR